VLDSFLLSHHREVVTLGNERHFLAEETFTVVKDLTGVGLDPPDRAILDGTHSVGDHMALYGLWLRQNLRRIRAQNKGLVNSRLAHIDERLLQVILLNKLILQLDCNDPTHRTARSAMGTMIQMDLTLLLCEVRLEQWGRIFNLWKLRGMDARDWGMRIAGAAAAAYTLLTLTSRQGSRVFLPTGHEDVYLGIDLFWLERGRRHAVSVKSVGGQSDPVRAWRVDAPPLNGGGDRVTSDQQAIYRGAQQFAASDGRPCIPVLVHVAKPEGGPIRLNQHWGRLTWPDRLLGGTVHQNGLGLAH